MIQTQKYGKVCYVPIGAERVGRVTVFVKEGQELKKEKRLVTSRMVN